MEIDKNWFVARRVTGLLADIVLKTWMGKKMVEIKMSKTPRYRRKFSYICAPRNSTTLV